jgi:hypothetical protein
MLQMQKTNPKRFARAPGLLGALCAFALLVACFIFPAEMFGVSTPFASIIIAGCFVWGVWRVIRRD